MSSVQVFVSFDLEHDSDLYDLFLAQSMLPGSGFEVSGRSGPWSMDTLEREAMRRRMCETTLVIFLCGEHTSACMHMSAELSLVQEATTPYFLVWGRRDIMCTKPVGAKPTEGMYSWTSQILQNRIAVTLRLAHAESQKAAASLRGATEGGP
jgi:hypothetical protein